MGAVTLSVPEPTLPEVGAVIDGKYRIDRELGTGGMGVVMAATHLKLGEQVALKFMLPEVARYPDAVARFSNEAQAASRIKSEHVARVLDVGTLITGIPYIVMEHLVGQDLRAMLREGRKNALDEIVEFILQACEAIAEAHALGIVHRDLKPENLFVVASPSGTPMLKVLDFGISRFERDDIRTSSSGRVLTLEDFSLAGSPLYMSPEQMMDPHHLDARSDIWALGVILYELITTRHPFAGASHPEICARVLTDSVSSVRGEFPEVPEALDEAMLKCLEKDPETRFQNVGELAMALLECSPKRARISVERVTGTLVTAGICPPALQQPLWTERASTEDVASSKRRDLEIVTPQLEVVGDGAGESQEVLAVVAPKRNRWVVPVIALSAVGAIGVVTFQRFDEQRRSSALPNAPGLAAPRSAAPPPTGEPNRSAVLPAPATEPSPATGPDSAAVASAAPKSSSGTVSPVATMRPAPPIRRVPKVGQPESRPAAKPGRIGTDLFDDPH